MSFVERVNQGESLASWLNWLTEPPAVCWSVIVGDLSASCKGDTGPFQGPSERVQEAVLCTACTFRMYFEYIWLALHRALCLCSNGIFISTVLKQLLVGVFSIQFIITYWTGFFTYQCFNASQNKGDDRKTYQIIVNTRVLVGVHCGNNISIAMTKLILIKTMAY